MLKTLIVPLGVTLFISMLSTWADDNKGDEEFPFQESAVRFRLNQGFFDLAGTLLEDILKATEVVSENNEVIIPRERRPRKPSKLKYRRVTNRFFMEEDKLFGDMEINIESSRIYLDDKDDCNLQMNGKLKLRIQVFLREDGPASVHLLKKHYNDKNLKVKLKKCGIRNLAPGGIVRNEIEKQLQDIFKQLFNEKEFRIVYELPVGEAMEEAAVFVNQPSFGDFFKDDGNINFIPSSEALRVVLGIVAYLSNSQKPGKITIENPSKTYLNELGLNWEFDGGLQPISENLYDKEFEASEPSSTRTPIEWGKAPFDKYGKKLDFDAGIIVKEAFLVSLFENLYQAGFFNFQIIHSLLPIDADINLDPNKMNEEAWIDQPDGTPINVENFDDARLEIVFNKPPAINFMGENGLLIQVPQFTLHYLVKSKDYLEEHSVVKIQASFKLLAEIKFGDGGRIYFDFNDAPISDFVIVEREGLAQDIDQARIKQELDTLMKQLLSKVDVTIPLMDDLTIELNYLGIDTIGEKNPEKALSIYLSVKE